MNTSNSSNWRAWFLPIVLLASLSVLAGPATASVGLADSLGAADDLFGSSLSEIEDLNNDGTWELLVGQPGFPSLANAGRVCLWWGGTDVSEHPNVTWTGVIPEKFGWSVARIGDVNDDGKPDWAVGAPGSNDGGLNKGKVYVYYGSSNPASITAVEILGEIGGDEFGYSVSAAGDFDHDGKDDFIIGAPFGANNKGAAYIIYGKSGGVSTDLADATRLVGEVNGNRFGWSVTDAGNFLGGTTKDCVAVGAPLNGSNFGFDSGAVYVFKGSLIPDADVDHIIGISGGNPAASQFGFAVEGIGRWNGDNLDDLAIGGPFNSSTGGSQAGRVDIVFGGTSPSGSGDRSVTGERFGDNLGYALARIWDVAGTGADDVLIGAPFHNELGVFPNASDAGRAYIYTGGSSSTGAGNLEIVVNEPINPGTEPDDYFGWGVGSAGDFDGDGAFDFAVGAPNGNNKDSARSGFVRLYDSSDLAVPALLKSWKAAWLTPDEDGLVLLDFALGLPAAAYSTVELVRSVDDAGREVDRALIWSGPAAHGAEGAGILTATGDGFRFRDPGPDRTLNDEARIAYDLSAFDDRGQQYILKALAGPAGPLPSAPTGLGLAPAWPNPANPAVTIRFRAALGEAVHLRILDVRGRLVRHLHSGTGNGAWQHEVWNGQDDAGLAAASGLYLIHLDDGHRALTQRVVLAR